MSRKERVKTTIDFIKGGVFALLTALFGIFAFVVIHIETINALQVGACVFGVIVIALAFYTHTLSD